MANLILTICSNHKRSGGRAYNAQGRYLPAQKRYDGRFYKAFGESFHGQSPLKVGEGFENHFLIVSGLYGVLTPTEPIQRYSCNIQDEPDIRKRWKKAGDSGIGLLTRILISYIQKFSITRIFEFMGDDSYRHLVDWDAISRETNSTIFYTHGEQQQGTDMLLELGEVAGLMLRDCPDNKLSTIKSGNIIEGVRFDSSETKLFTRVGSPTRTKRRACESNTKSSPIGREKTTMAAWRN